MGRKLLRQSRPCINARSNFNERQMLNLSAIATDGPRDRPSKSRYHYHKPL